MKKPDWPPKLAELLKKAGYRKHGVSVYVQDHYTFRQPYWSGGSRDSHALMDLDGRQAGLRVRNATAWPAPPAEDTIPLEFGQIAVLGGTFCGKPASWALTMNRQTATHLGIPEDYLRPSLN